MYYSHQKAFKNHTKKLCLNSPQNSSKIKSKKFVLSPQKASKIHTIHDAVCENVFH